MVTIREARREDLPEWLRLRRDLWPACTGEEHRVETAAMLDGTGCDPEAGLLAFDGEGRAVGFAELSIRSHAEGCAPGRIAYLEGWFVAAGSRRRGIGRALVAAAERWGRARGCREFASDTGADNEAGARAHRALGFIEAGLTRCFRKEL